MVPADFKDRPLVFPPLHQADISRPADTLLIAESTSEDADIEP
jgi:hypothetical protein